MKQRIPAQQKALDTMLKEQEKKINHKHLLMTLFFRYYFAKWWRPIPFLICAIALVVFGEALKSSSFSRIGYVFVFSIIISILISALFHFFHKRLLNALFGFILFGTLVLGTNAYLMSTMFEPDAFGDTITFEGKKFELFNPIPLSIGKDTLLPEIWFRTLNVDGDNERIIRIVINKDTVIFNLPNAVNNYTDVTCYSLEIGKNHFLWLEDNFGTTVFDIDEKRLKNVRHPVKKLTEIADTGTSIGVKKQISIPDMRNQLRLDEKVVLKILDSLHFRM